MTENHLRHVNALIFVDLDRYSLAVVPDRYQVLLWPYLHLDLVHGLVSLEVIGRVNEYLV